MLAITENAAAAINALTTHSEMPEGSGVRIAADASGEGLALDMVTSPDGDDAVVEQHGATVYLEPQAAQLLDDKTLDVMPSTDANSQGGLEFAVLSR
jgi:Fe-S cluster assembly iron-binding protein IscA